MEMRYLFGFFFLAFLFSHVFDPGERTPRPRGVVVPQISDPVSVLFGQPC